VEKGITCPNCGASSNSFGTYLGASTIRCIRCGFDYDYKTGEFSYRGTSSKSQAKRLEMQKIKIEVHGQVKSIVR
jgi:rubredoxin